MQLSVTYQGGTKFAITSAAHEVTTDQPPDDGGSDAGMSPVELFVGSLAGCVGYFVAKYCARHGIAADGFRVDADWSMAEQPHRIGNVALRITLPTALSPSQKERLLQVAHGCTIHRTLEIPPTLEVTLGEPKPSRTVD
jgi:putative redox protein